MLHIIAAILLASATLSAAPAAPEATHEATHRAVSGDELKSWYDQKKPMTVLDARSAKYFDNRLLPNAIWLPSDTAEAKITEVLPNKESLVVVYCAGVGCPASGWLFDKLTKMGYSNVYEYHGGINEWSKKGYIVVNSK